MSENLKSILDLDSGDLVILRCKLRKGYITISLKTVVKRSLGRSVLLGNGMTFSRVTGRATGDFGKRYQILPARRKDVELVRRDNQRRIISRELQIFDFSKVPLDVLKVINNVLKPYKKDLIDTRKAIISRRKYVIIPKRNTKTFIT